jgi:SAM-dependent methyltransferase
MTERIPEEHRAQLRSTLSSSDDVSLLDAVSDVVSPQDGMFRGNGKHNYAVGLSAMRSIRRALERGRPQAAAVHSILDLPCGFGRVLRFLRPAFPAASVHACDILQQGVEFCAAELGAVPAYSRPDLQELHLETRFDLIWCGSLVTHLPAHRTRELLRFFGRHLAPGGTLIFSTHGEFVAAQMRKGEDHGSRQKQVDAALDAYSHDSYGFVANPRQENYGISLTSPACIRTLLNGIDTLQEVDFQPRAWDQHHDLFTLTHCR